MEERGEESGKELNRPPVSSPALSVSLLPIFFFFFFFFLTRLRFLANRKLFINSYILQENVLIQ